MFDHFLFHKPFCSPHSMQQKETKCCLACSGDKILERARLALLDDWRFNEDIIPYALQLLWFEGAPFIISRPQNQFSGHLRYAKDDPVFITTLQSDLTELKGKKFLQQGDVEMMLKRLLVFNFTKPIAIPKPVVQRCAHCFAHFLVSHPLLPKL